MKLNEISKDELELMGYDDIALLVLQENGKKMKLQDIFAKVCKILELPEGTVQEQLVDFFEQMSINKKFIMLQNGFWDLQSRHKPDFVIEEDEEDDIIAEDEEDELNEDIETEEDEDIFYDKDEETDDVPDDELADFVVIDAEDENNL